MASKDLTPILRDWPYSADRITARKIIGRDSTIKIQLRIELGVLQMEPIGRPDGRDLTGRNRSCITIRRGSTGT